MAMSQGRLIQLFASSVQGLQPVCPGLKAGTFLWMAQPDPAGPRSCLVGPRGKLAGLGRGMQRPGSLVVRHPEQPRG